MNDISKTIGWADKSWNPVVGCKHGCTYCYAKRLNNRFKWIPKWDEPRAFEDRYYEPRRLKKPSKIFVCSMSDLFGEWIPSGLRLNPILREELPKEVGTEKDSQPLAPLANTLRAISYDISAQATSIEEILARLEL